MPRSDEVATDIDKPARIMPLIITLAVGAVYYFSNPKPQYYYDYTFRVAANILGGHIGFTDKQPSWLNEFVPFEGFYYSVFPLGSVVSMMPFALLKTIGAIGDMPAAFIAALCAAASSMFLYLISRHYELCETRRWTMIAGMMFGSWTWTNLTMGGAWQLALGFAMAAELGAIYFTVYDRRPWLAGFFFAVAFGNRTEILLTAPIFFYLLVTDTVRKPRLVNGTKLVPAKRNRATVSATPAWRTFLSRPNILRLAQFCAVPFALGLLTLLYNYVRFRSFTDFGYARIPGVLDEPWYNHGIFSYRYIPGQIWEMLLRTWETRNAFPYLAPDGFSSSILWSSPLVLFAFRGPMRGRILTIASWSAILVLCVLLWMHGNSGGWQFGYRYAMVCLPWLFVILLESAPKKISLVEWTAYGFSFAANFYATWLFHWTEYLDP